MANKWEKVEAGNAWKPEKEGDEIFGLLIGKEENVGQYNSTLYQIQKTGDEGEVVEVWGSTVLDQRLKNTKIGEEVKITFLGKGKASGGKNPAKLFDVFHRQPKADDYDNIGDIADEIFNSDDEKK